MLLLSRRERDPRLGALVWRERAPWSVGETDEEEQEEEQEEEEGESKCRGEISPTTTDTFITNIVKPCRYAFASA